MKVVFAMPTISEPHRALVKSLRAELPLIEAAGFEHEMTVQIGSPYISHARAVMLGRAEEAGADVIVFLDHDMSWRAGDLLRLIQTPGEVVSALYRFKREPEEYMGSLAPAEDGQPIVRDDGCIRADWIPAGFMKITKEGVERFRTAYPELRFGGPGGPYLDLFNHGACDGVWWGEDYAFSRRWNAMGGEIWVVPDLEVTHHDMPVAKPARRGGHTPSYTGNFALYLRRQPGGDLAPETKSAA